MPSLNTSGNEIEASSVYLSYLADYGILRQDDQSREITTRIHQGRRLAEAAKVSQALPFQKASSQRLAAAAAKAERNAGTLEEQAQRALQINNDTEKRFSHLDGAATRQRKEFEAAFKEGERKRDRRSQTATEAKTTEAEQRFSEEFVSIRKTLAGFRDEAKKTNRELEARSSKQEAEFEALKTLFKEHMGLRAPVELWKTRELLHARKAKVGLLIFIVLCGLAVIAAAFVPYKLGPAIAGSFTQEICRSEAIDSCTRVFSAEGPLIVAGMLLVLSLALWSIRLQYRVYLSERHLALDASEKGAFVETYLAMKEGKGLNDSNEAIVLGALFRPTQDGIIKDDESALDISAAAVIAKQLSK